MGISILPPSCESRELNSAGLCPPYFISICMKVLLFKLLSSKISACSFSLCWYIEKLPHSEGHKSCHCELLLMSNSPQMEWEPWLDLPMNSAKEVHAGSRVTEAVRSETALETP